jgi:hypothetical protein
MHTATTLAKLIASHMEPDHAERVLAALKPHDGEPITTRLLDKLPGGRVEWRMTRELGRTDIKNRAFKRGMEPEGLELTLANSEASVPLDVAYVERENARYFEARRHRNAQRKAAISDTPLLTRLAFIMNEIEDLTHKLAFAKAQFAAFVEDRDAPLYPERYELERACGLRKE